jgi:hypothetical protein
VETLTTATTKSTRYEPTCEAAMAVTVDGREGRLSQCIDGDLGLVPVCDNQVSLLSFHLLGCEPTKRRK